jgi:glycosyltransferase involved in cell wall biosynthesis
VSDLVGADAAWLVPPSSPHDLAAAMSELLADAVGARRRGDALRARARSEFSPARWAERHERVYREAMDIRRRRP